MKILKTMSGLIKSLKLYWKKPPEGRYMSFKEIASLSFGGIGERLITYCISQMVISIGNSLIGNTIGIRPSAMYVIYMISVLSGFPLTALRAKIIDNTRSMKGKYRPYLITMGLPSTLLGIGFIVMPYENMSMFWKCAVVLAFNIGFQFFYCFYTDSYDSLINVLSPNSIERSDVLSIRSIVENISPSIASIFLPLVAKAITGENTLYNLKVYRVLFPAMLAGAFLISLPIYINTQEKIVQAKTHVIQMKFSDAFRAIARNKYFWIISLAGWLGFLESSFGNIMGWMYNYQSACTPAQYSIITAIAGNASFWPNIIAPFFIRKYGKKKILVSTNILNIFFIALMLPIVRMTGNPGIIWLLLICTFVNTLITSFGHLLNPSIQADIRDYQQYVTGERIDGMFAAVGLIGNVVTLATSFVLPALYEKAGLNSSVALSLGYDGSNVYDVLYNNEYFVKISSVLIIASVVGAALNVIPFFFYDLTETKQKAMVKVLKIRALFEDYGNNVLSDSALVETVEIINEAREYAGRKPNELNSGEIKKAKKSRNRQAVREAKANLRKKLEENEKIEIADIVTQELHRFETPYGIAEIKNAEKFVEAGLDNFSSVFTLTRKQARAMPKRNNREKENRRNAIILVSNVKSAQKAMKKYFPNGIEEFDSTIFEDLFRAEDETELELNEALKALKNARERKNAQEISKQKRQIKNIHFRKEKIKEEIKDATDKNSIYYRAAKPYLDAKKTLAQMENYRHLEEITSLYEGAKERLAIRQADESAVSVK